MPLPLDANGTDGQCNHFPMSEPLGLDVEGTNHDAHPEKTCLHCDEYTTLLKKHLGIVESELSKLKGSQRSVLPRDSLRNRRRSY